MTKTEREWNEACERLNRAIVDAAKRDDGLRRALGLPPPPRNASPYREAHVARRVDPDAESVWRRVDRTIPVVFVASAIVSVASLAILVWDAAGRPW